MIKKIKKYFYMRKVKKEMQVEILETLATICLYLEREGRYPHNPMAQHMRSHFAALKIYSDMLRKAGGIDEFRNSNSYCKKY